MRKVEILLATYNGEKYLSQQIDSIINQSYTNWILTIRDDCSTDSTKSLIDQYTKEFPDKIRLLNNNGVNLGSTKSFSELLQNSQEEFVMLCDQDDIWLNNKIELSLERMLQIEFENPSQPLLVFTDMKVVDKDLQLISNSFIKAQKLITGVITDYRQLIAHNVVAGCTTLMNKKAVEITVPIISNKLIHDHWISIIVSYYGTISFIDVPTSLYRQHGRNVVGASSKGLGYFVRKLVNPVTQMEIYIDLIKYLPFRTSIIILLYYKVHFTIKRLIIR